MNRRPIIRVESLDVTPDEGGAPILRGVDFGVAEGERVVLTGPSGSGKSTLLRCMVLLERAEGHVLLDGERVGPERVRELRRRVGYLPQRPVSIADTVAANLAFPETVGAAGLDARARRSLLDRLGLDGLELDRRFDTLSGGEQQRVALVRSLAAGPDVLLLDEPAASLDPENVGAVTDLVAGWVESEPGRALVWVSHHAHEVAALATRRVEVGEISA